MAGRDPGGAVATLAMGVGGTVIGCGVFAYFAGSMERITPITPVGFVVATGGAFTLLFFYKLLGAISSSKARCRAVSGDHITPEVSSAKWFTTIDAPICQVSIWHFSYWALFGHFSI